MGRERCCEISDDLKRDEIWLDHHRALASRNLDSQGRNRAGIAHRREVLSRPLLERRVQLKFIRPGLTRMLSTACRQDMSSFDPMAAAIDWLDATFNN